MTKINTRKSINQSIKRSSDCKNTNKAVAGLVAVKRLLLPATNAKVTEDDSSPSNWSSGIDTFAQSRNMLVGLSLSLLNAKPIRKASPDLQEHDAIDCCSEVNRSYSAKRKMLTCSSKEKCDQLDMERDVEDETGMEEELTNQKKKGEGFKCERHVLSNSVIVDDDKLRLGGGGKVLKRKYHHLKVWNKACFTLFISFLITMPSSASAQGWDRSRLSRSGSSSKRSSGNGQSCGTFDDSNETMLGTSCNFEEPCQWKWKEPDPRQTGFRNMTPDAIMKKMHKVGEWAFRGPLMDRKNKTDGKTFTFLVFSYYEVNIGSKLKWM